MHAILYFICTISSCIELIVYTLQTIYALKKGRSIGDLFDYFELLNSFKNPDADVYVFPFQIISSKEPESAVSPNT